MANGISLKNPSAIGIWFKIIGSVIAFLFISGVVWSSLQNGVVKNKECNLRQDIRITKMDNDHLTKLARIEKLGTAISRKNHEDVAVMRGSQIRMEGDIKGIITKLDKALERRPGGG